MNTHSNPVLALSILSEMEVTNRAYLGRTLVSCVNAMMIGQVVLHLRNTTPAEGSGIDGANDMLAAALEREIDKTLGEDAGFESNTPDETAGILINVASEIIEALGLSPNVAAAINTPLATLKFIESRNGDQKIDPKTAERLAAALEIDLEDAVKAMTANAKKRADEFARVAPLIPDAIMELTIQGSFDDLPNRMKMRVAQKFEQHLGAKLSNEIGRVISGSAQNMADVAFLKSAIKVIKEWINAHNDTDELARALRAAA